MVLRGAREWLLKRFLRFFLSRALGRYLNSDLDLHQLEVKLESGSLELKNVRLAASVLNSDLVRMRRARICAAPHAAPTMQPPSIPPHAPPTPGSQERSMLTQGSMCAACTHNPSSFPLSPSSGPARLSSRFMPRWQHQCTAEGELGQLDAGQRLQH
jgi:hypothetical protein